MKRGQGVTSLLDAPIARTQSLNRGQLAHSPDWQRRYSSSSSLQLRDAPSMLSPYKRVH